MICPKCKAEASGRFCSNCGAPLGEQRAPLEKSADGWMERGETGEEEEIEELWEDGSWEEKESPGQRYGSPSRSSREYDRETEGGQREVKSRKKKEKEARSRKKPAESAKGSRKKSEKKAEKRIEKKSASNDNRSSKTDKKAERRKEERIRQLEERLEKWERSAGRRREKGAEENGENSSLEVKETAAKTVAGIAVLISRLLQLACFVLMAGITGLAACIFYINKEGLGRISTALQERNYGLAVYMALAGVALFMGVVWSLWTLSKKAAGGEVRMKSYDTGRGLIPFLLICLFALAAGQAVPYFPLLETGLAGHEEIALGIETFVKAVNDNGTLFLTGASAGAVFSLIRKLLKV